MGLFLWHIKHCRLLISNPFIYIYIYIYINSSLSNKSVQFFVYTQLNIKTVPFQIIQFSISIEFQYQKTVPFQEIQFNLCTQFSSIWPIDSTLSGVTTPRHSGLGSDSNEEVFCIPQSSSNTGTSPWHCLVSLPGHSLGWSYSSAEMQLVYSTNPAD